VACAISAALHLVSSLTSITLDESMSAQRIAPQLASLPDVRSGARERPP